MKDEKKAEAILAWAVDKMEERYEWLHRARVRNIAGYNELPFEEIVRRVNPDSEEELRNIPRKMPYIVIVIDEVGDLMMKMKKEIEGNIILLAQKSRAAGIHLILATQKPTVDVITGLIKSNLPARICFQVTSRSDSAVVLDEKGAERLLGRATCCSSNRGRARSSGRRARTSRTTEIERVVNAIATDTPNYDSELLNLKTRDQMEAGGGRRGRREAPRARPAVRAGGRDRHPRAARQHVAAPAGAWASATARRRGSSTTWPRTASSGRTTAATPARCWSRPRSGSRGRSAVEPA